MASQRSDPEPEEEIARGPSQWWRFDEYEVINGLHIAPAEGAELEWYEPIGEWEEYWEGRSQVGGTDPYTSLVNLDLEDEGAIADWCSEHGLLGILPHRTLAAFLEPRWLDHERRAESGPFKADEFDDVVEKAERTVVAPSPVQRQYTDRWQVTRTALTSVPVDVWPAEERRGDLVTEEDIERFKNRILLADVFGTGFQPTRVRILSEWIGGTEEVDVARGIGQFFPGREIVRRWTQAMWDEDADEEADKLSEVVSKQDFPLPGDPEFFRAYGEPVLLFQMYVKSLQDTLEFWQEATEAPDESVELPDSFTSALKPVNPSVELIDEGDGKQWRRTWEIPSLFSALNVMILQDFPLREASSRICPQCGKTFVTDNKQKRFCRPKCREANYMARYRAGETGDNRGDNK